MPLSGIYLAKLVRTDTGGASHIVFVVRDDGGHSDLLFQTSDTTWQAYNDYGGNSLYTGRPRGRAYKVSYNRPFSTRGDADGGKQSWLFNAEYPMVRWLEANGYDVELHHRRRHRSARAGAPRAQGVPLGRPRRVLVRRAAGATWKPRATRASTSPSSAATKCSGRRGGRTASTTSGTPHRTLVCYKETHANAKIDPSPRLDRHLARSAAVQPRRRPAPENALTGTIFMVNGTRHDSIMVPASDGKHAVLAQHDDRQPRAGSDGHSAARARSATNGTRTSTTASGRPACMRLSSTTLDVSPLYLLDHGTTYGAGTATHSLTLYRHKNGGTTPDSLVFGAGTVQWSWGLDSTHDRVGAACRSPHAAGDGQPVRGHGRSADHAAQRSWSPRAQSADAAGPTSTVNALPAAAVETGFPVTITGTASDGQPAASSPAVEVSTDGGAHWNRADGRESWTYRWTPAARGSVTI